MLPTSLCSACILTSYLYIIIIFTIFIYYFYLFLFLCLFLLFFIIYYLFLCLFIIIIIIIFFFLTSSPSPFLHQPIPSHPISSRTPSEPHPQLFSFRRRHSLSLPLSPPTPIITISCAAERAPCSRAEALEAQEGPRLLRLRCG
jgi:hypothetical protein